MEISKLITHILDDIFVVSINNKQIVESITTYTDRTLAWSFNDYLKKETFPENIEAFVNRWGQLIVDDLENGGQVANKHVNQLFKVS